MRSRDYVISRFTNPNNTPQPTPRTSAGRRNLPTVADWERDALAVAPASTHGQTAGSSSGLQAAPVQTLSVTSGSVESKKRSEV